MKPAERLTLFRRLSLFGALLALCVVVLGAWVRLNDAGLGCPDWPGCYGHVSAADAEQNLDVAQQRYPDRRFEYSKAVKEMTHRYVASTLGLVILVLAGMAYANRREPNQPVKLPLLLVPLVILQGLLGMWTVTLLLKPLIVVLHLIGGLTTMSLLAWQSMRVDRSTRPAAERNLRKFALIGLIVLGIQIFLGGWTSTNYAAVSCPDFPTCQASYWPDMDAKDAFVLWRGLGIDYEGGVLNHPARVAIHFFHRVGALTTAIVLGFVAFLAWTRAQTRAVQFAGLMVGVVLLVQLILGPMMVIKGFPLWMATAHNGVAALLLLSVVRLNRLLRVRTGY
ncbi:MAG: COX15/CtaA family protein [Steroidobacteraceae bacterium]